MFGFLESVIIFKMTKTNNKKFFFQQNILIFANCLENIYKMFLYRFCK